MNEIPFSNSSSPVGSSQNSLPTSPRRHGPAAAKPKAPNSPTTPTRQLLRKKAQRLPATLPPSKPNLPHMERFRITVEERSLFPRFWFIAFAKALCPRDPKSVRLIDAPNHVLGITPQRRADIEKAGQAHHSNYFVMEEISGKKYFVKRTLNRDRAKREWLAYQKFREARIPNVMYASFWFETKEEEHDNKEAGFIVFKYLPCWTLNEIDRHPEYSASVSEEDWLRGLIQISTVFNMTDPENVDQGSLGFYHRDMHAGQIVLDYEKRDWLLIDFGLSRLLFTERRALNPHRPDEKTVVEVELDMVPGSGVHCTPEQEWNRLKSLFKPGLKKIWSKIEDLFKESSRLTTVCKLRDFYEDRYQKPFEKDVPSDDSGNGVAAPEEEGEVEYEQVFPEAEGMTYVEAAQLEHQRIQERATRNIKGFQEQVRLILANAQRARRQATASTHYSRDIYAPLSPTKKTKPQKQKKQKSTKSGRPSQETSALSSSASAQPRKLDYGDEAEEIDIEGDHPLAEAPESDYEPEMREVPLDEEEEYHDEEEDELVEENESEEFKGTPRNRSAPSSAPSEDFVLDFTEEDLKFMSPAERSLVLEAKKLFSREQRRRQQERERQEEQRSSKESSRRPPSAQRQTPAAAAVSSSFAFAPTPPPPLPYHHEQDEEEESEQKPSEEEEDEDELERAPKIKVRVPRPVAPRPPQPTADAKRPLTADERLLEETNKILERETRRLQRTAPSLSSAPAQLSSTRTAKTNRVITYKEISSSSFGEEDVEEEQEEMAVAEQAVAHSASVAQPENQKEEEEDEDVCFDSSQPQSTLSDGSSLHVPDPPVVIPHTATMSSAAVVSLPPALPFAHEVLPAVPKQKTETSAPVLPVKASPLSLTEMEKPVEEEKKEIHVSPVRHAAVPATPVTPPKTQKVSQPSATTPKRRRGGDSALFDEAEKMQQREQRKLERLQGKHLNDEEEEENDKEEEPSGSHVIIHHQSPAKQIASTPSSASAPARPTPVPIAAQDPTSSSSSSSSSASSSSASSESDESEQKEEVRQRRTPSRTPQRARRSSGEEEGGPSGSPSSAPLRVTRKEINTLNEEAQKMIARMERRAAGK